jgi:hypothetical protein
MADDNIIIFNVTSNNNNDVTNDVIYTTRDTSTDFVTSSDADLVGLAVLCIWAYLIREFLFCFVVCCVI